MDVKQSHMGQIATRVGETIRSGNPELMTDPQKILTLGERLIQNSHLTDVDTAVEALGLDPATVVGLNKAEVGQAIASAARMVVSTEPKGQDGYR